MMSNHTDKKLLKFQQDLIVFIQAGIKKTKKEKKPAKISFKDFESAGFISDRGIFDWALADLKAKLGFDFRYEIKKVGKISSAADINGERPNIAPTAIEFFVNDKKLSDYLIDLKQRLKKYKEKHSFTLGRIYLYLDGSEIDPIEMEPKEARYKTIFYLAKKKGRPATAEDLSEIMEKKPERVSRVISEIRGLVQTRFKIPGDSLIVSISIKSELNKVKYAAPEVRIDLESE